MKEKITLSFDEKRAAWAARLAIRHFTKVWVPVRQLLAALYLADQYHLCQVGTSVTDAEPIISSGCLSLRQIEDILSGNEQSQTWDTLFVCRRPLDMDLTHSSISLKTRTPAELSELEDILSVSEQQAVEKGVELANEPRLPVSIESMILFGGRDQAFVDDILAAQVERRAFRRMFEFE